jgi:hypothetical protein
VREETAVQSSLGLAGDLDDVELIEDVEEAFDVRFSDDDLRQCHTVGDLFDLVSNSLPEDDPSRKGCSTAICFYRLRQVLQPRFGIALKPATPITQLSEVPVRKLYRAIRDECGFRPPVPVISMWGCVGLLLVPGLPLAAIAFGLPWWLAPIAALPGIATYAVSPIRLPAEVRTFADLVRIVAARNVRALSDQGARLRKPEAWTALKKVISDHTVLPHGEIKEDTLILAASKARA